MKFYDELASWWPLMSPPEDYAEEAAFFERTLLDAGAPPGGAVLELGCGGGNNASYLKRRFRMTLTDASAGMLDVSRTLNPECEHVQGDMRTLRLGRRFDAVFVHDAICYMTSLEDLRRALETAAVHCRPGGVALFAPDCLRETFREGTEEGGEDGDGRALRYLAWMRDPDPADCTYVVDYALLLREGATVTVEHDRHVEGLFSREEWLTELRGAGFQPRIVPFDHSELDPGTYELFLCGL